MPYLDQKEIKMACPYEKYKTVGNGTISCCNHPQPNMCQTTCDRRENSHYFLLRGRPFNECLPDGRWRFPFARCILLEPANPCVMHGKPENGYTACTIEGCFTECDEGYHLYGKTPRKCNHDALYPHWEGEWPQCQYKNYAEGCTLEDRKKCYNSGMKCDKETAVPLCSVYASSIGVTCICVDIETKGNCSVEQKLKCRDRKPDCFPSEHLILRYTETRTCNKVKGRLSCTCKNIKKFPCAELYKPDPLRDCHILRYGHEFQCRYRCNEFEYIADYRNKGTRYCKVNKLGKGKWMANSKVPVCLRRY